MRAYITFGAIDPTASLAFYEATLPIIGWAKHAEFAEWRAYSEAGSGEGLVLWVATPFNEEPATAGNGTMLGLYARSKAEVDAFHAAALAHGGSDEGAPGPRAAYGPNWYAAYLRDPTGNKIGVVYTG